MNLFILIIKELRINHWIKNLIVFMPIFFGSSLLKTDKFFESLLVFILFCLVSSIVYVINDICDIKEDQKHPVKKNRPLASGALNLNLIISICILLFLISIILICLLNNLYIVAVLIGYFLINIVYSLFVKNIVLWDIFFIAAMYILRLYAGSIITDIVVSEWLFTTVFFGSLILVISKRYTEIRNNSVRKVLAKYTSQFLHSILLVSICVTLVSFATYSISHGWKYIPLIAIFAITLFRYYFLVEVEKKGEKPEILFFTDYQLLSLLSFFLIYIGLVLYVFK
jgi:decaprenyl-phosphate phosphoribosyltransferase